MQFRFFTGLAVLWLSIAAAATWADEPTTDQPTAEKPADEPVAKDNAPDDLSVQQLTAKVRQSVAVISFDGRDGKRQGLGSGFVISPDGLIATNYHVIGEARPINVEFAGGKKYAVTEVRASDRQLDLAIIKIDAKELTPLPLGDSDSLAQGQSVVALGNPHGLTLSVVAGVVSGVREMEGRPMIQLAIPIEPGNSGGPLLDMQGRVHGILTMKSLVTPNLGFALTSNALKTLIDKPNPIPMSRWLTIGMLDARQWKPLFGANWRRRGSRLIVQDAGQGFGGRALCLAQQVVPPRPYEVAVSVKLDDEQGAAGLVFGADGGDKHFGFYPSAGKLRLTHFDGSDVLSWHVLRDEPNVNYDGGEWNTLRVRVEKDKFLCYVNDHLVYETTDEKLVDGQVGLAKFRQTKAEFKNFRIGENLAGGAKQGDASAELAKLVEAVSQQTTANKTDKATIEKLAAEPTAAVALRDKAKALDERATELRRLADSLHEQRIVAALTKALTGEEAGIDLMHAALLVAALDNEELDVEAYRREADQLAADISSKLPAEADDAARLAALRKYLFEENGFHGSRADYYNRANSYLNEVLDDREGLPITLSVLYLHLAAKLGVPVVGVGLPGHFIVAYQPKEGDPQWIDVYEGATQLTRDDVAKKLPEMAGRELQQSDLATAGKRAIIVRMLHNLLGVASGKRDAAPMLRYLNCIVALTPDAAQDRWMRAVVNAGLRRPDAALEDIDWLRQKQPLGLDLGRIEELHGLLQQQKQ